MAKIDLNSSSVSEIIAAYERGVKSNGLAIINRDGDAANAAYDFVWLCSKELKKRGIDAQRKLLSLLENDGPQVRLCAAKDALGFAPELGQQELERISNLSLLWSIDAKLILEEWKAGRLKFP